jgi:hypothetical protein
MIILDKRAYALEYITKNGAYRRLYGPRATLWDMAHDLMALSITGRAWIRQVSSGRFVACLN